MPYITIYISAAEAAGLKERRPKSLSAIFRAALRRWLKRQKKE